MLPVAFLCDDLQKACPFAVNRCTTVAFRGRVGLSSMAVESTFDKDCVSSPRSAQSVLDGHTIWFRFSHDLVSRIIHIDLCPAALEI